MLTARVGDPPRLRGYGPEGLLRFAIACRASAIVLERGRHPGPAAHLRRLARAADLRATVITSRHPDRSCGAVAA